MNVNAFSFIVEGEIAHFRDPFTHAFFNTFIAPPPHTILGFLGGCLGYDEIEVENLGEGLQIGCIVKRIGGYLKDLAIVSNQKGGKNINTPRTRRFLINPSYHIFVFSEKISLLDEIRNSVYAPRFVPFLGTSDCIAYIRYISKITKAEQIETKGVKSLINLDKINHKETKFENRFSTTIIDPKMLTIYPFYALCPSRYQISDNGRQPINFQRILMSVNCLIKFESPISAYRCDGDQIFPL